MTGNISSDLIRGHTDTIILGLLLEGDSYGYEAFNKTVQSIGNISEIIGVENIKTEENQLHDFSKKCLEGSFSNVDLENLTVIKIIM